MSNNSEEKEVECKTKNIKFCAFLKLNGINPIRVNKLGRGRGEFIYVMSQERWDNWKIQFNSSPYIEYAHCLESIKDLCY